MSDRDSPDSRVIRLGRQKLVEAAASAGAEPDIAGRIWQELTRDAAYERRFDMVHVLYYMGALIAIGAMGWWLGLKWDDLGGGAIALIAAAYAVLYGAVGAYLWRKAPETRTPGGLWIAMAVALTPLFVYGLQRHFGLWAFDDPGEYRNFFRWIRGGWFAMEVATIAVAVLVLSRVRFPFLTAIIAFMLWYLSMDLTPILFGSADFAWQERRLVSLVFGLVILGVAYSVDLRSRTDFAFWLYLAGATSFWGGLSLLDSSSELSRFGYFLINLVLILASVYLRRRIFIIFGAFGVIWYLGHLSLKIFPDEALFPIALTVTGALVVLLGILLQRRHAAIEAWLERSMPGSVLAMRPKSR
ncbi:hypothetical protein [Nisaea sp.]|uniref:hypothetical protein n=1 Tax=Nisaea sp. TaxID=2024842 RepID=UPI002B264B0B|nr:hypothetical protein [Nisaea sp.]